MKLTLKTRNDLLVLPDIETPEDRSIERKRLRRNQVLNIIRVNGPISHSEVARRAGLNLRTVKGHIEELIDNGLVAEDEQKEKTMGRPAPLDRIRPDGFCFLGLSFLDDKVSFSIMGLDCRVILSNSMKLDGQASAAARVEASRDFLVESIRPEQEKLPPLAGVILCTPDHEFTNSNYFGLVFPKAGTWQAALFRMLTTEFQVPILMENQGRVDAIASLWFGAGKEHKSFAYIGVGSHPRVTYIEDTRLHYGYLGQAGDLTTLIDSEGTPFTDRISSEALVKRAQTDGLKVTTLEEIAALARNKKDSKALAIFEELATDLSILTAMSASLLSPEAVILGGSIGSCGDLVEASWKEKTHKLLPEKLSLRLDLECCRLAADNPELSPVAFGFHHLFNTQRLNLQDLL
ncbi:MAG: ROK family transcriptional regulator [Candidatus Sumerlaeia bacterium]|nr:ROK family transcriptional regulator [Candidatus Sumerlaeia bacterium]